MSIARGARVCVLFLGLLVTPAAVADVTYTVNPGFEGGVRNPAAGDAFVPSVPNVVQQSLSVALAGWWGSLYWCNNQGPNTAISGARVQVVRWHDPTLVRVEFGPSTDGSGGVSQPENTLTKGAPTTLSIGPMAVQCVGARARQTGTQASLPTRIWNFTLAGVDIADQQGPAVSAPVVTGPGTGGWLTGPVTVTWVSSDNLVLRGRTGAQIGPARDDKGVAPDGQQSTVLDPGPDGKSFAVVFREGQGWPTAFASTPIQVDRTPPSVPVLAPGQAAADGSITVLAGGSTDATSGLDSYEYTADAGASVLASPTLRRAGNYQVQARAVDIAGNRSRWSPAVPVLVTRTSAGPGGTSDQILDGSTVVLPDFTNVHLARIRSGQAHGRNRIIGGRPVPNILVTFGHRFTVTGRFAHRNHRGLRGATVVLRSPRGMTLAATLTDRRGKFALTFRPTLPGRFTVSAIGAPEVDTALIVRVRPQVRLIGVPRRIRAVGRLVVTGRVLPGAWARGKRLELQFFSFGHWRSGPSGRVGARGRFTISYPLRAVGRFEIPLRVVVPTDRGWRFAPATSRVFTVAVSG